MCERDARYGDVGAHGDGDAAAARAALEEARGRERERGDALCARLDGREDGSVTLRRGEVVARGKVRAAGDGDGVGGTVTRDEHGAPLRGDSGRVT